MYDNGEVTFEWNEAKSESCGAKRGFDFQYAATVFEDEHRVEDFNREAQDGELRYYTIGCAAFSDVLYVVFTWRKYENLEEVCRIISARRASKKERRRYQEIQ